MKTRLAAVRAGQQIATDRPDTTDFALVDRGLLLLVQAPHENAPGGHMARTRFYRKLPTGDPSC